MASSLAKLMPGLLAVAAAAWAMQTGAQTTGDDGQPILFSSPDSAAVATNLPSLTPKAPDLGGAADITASAFDFNAPPSSPPRSAPRGRMPAPVPTGQLQALLDRRENWTLLTPAEILDVPTPEKILGVREYGADGLPLHQSAVERFYARQDRLRAGTNAAAGMAFLTAADAFGSHTSFWNQAQNSGLWNAPDSFAAGAVKMNSFFRGLSDNSSGFNSAPGDGWTKWFNPPTLQSEARAPAQPAPSDVFQQLLTPAPAPTGSGLANKSLSPPGGADNSLFGGSPLNPGGVSAAPLSGVVGSPIGMTPLPGVLGPTNPAPTTFNSQWKPELPPWMTQGPQPGVIPQRKF